MVLGGIMTEIEHSEKKDKRINTVMLHPLFGEILIKDVRVTPERTYAYFEGTVCNINILSKIKEK